MVPIKNKKAMNILSYCTWLKSYSSKGGVESFTWTKIKFNLKRCLKKEEKKNTFDYFGFPRQNKSWNTRVYSTMENRWKSRQYSTWILGHFPWFFHNVLWKKCGIWFCIHHLVKKLWKTAGKSLKIQVECTRIQ